MIVVDDGSTDPETLVALDGLSDRARVLRRANAGPAAARNAGVSESDTPFLVLLDADDELPPYALNAWKAALADRPDAAFAYGDRQFVGAMTGIQHFPPYDPLKLLDRHLIGITALTRREVFEAVGGLDASYDAYEDWEFWLHALEHGYRGVHVDSVTLLYRRHAGSKFEADRAALRAFRRRVKRDHAALYARRRQLAAESDMGAFERSVYRWFWGPRPIPAAIDRLAQRLLWPGTASPEQTVDSPAS